MPRTTHLLLILDGWGHRAPEPDNAITQARTPHWSRLLAECPHTLIHTHGLHVGLPADQMGNSEVGHMNIGAGRIVYQDLTRIDAAIADGSFQRNAVLMGVLETVQQKNSRLHVMGLLSSGGVHSHEEHFYALLDMARESGIEVILHVFLDGRDTPPRSAESSLQRLQEYCVKHPSIRIGSVGGRYYGMDRDKRWERVEPAYRVITEGEAEFVANDPVAALHQAYERGENDEFVRPSRIGAAVKMQDGDAVLFMNFRADRARQITSAFVKADFNGFERPRAIALSQFVSLTEYASELKTTVAFPPQSLANSLPEYLAGLGKTQLRIAETEKYAHVTFFFSGGREQPFVGESRILVPSPKVATYDLQPEMSCPEVTRQLCEAIRSGEFDLIVCNLANPDMVGHTGILAAAVQAVEAIDSALGKITQAIDETKSVMLVTADHGNLEMMLDPENGQPHTAHTMNPVYLVYRGPQAVKWREGGALKDIAPTLLDLMHTPKPAEMSGDSLLV